MAHKGKRTRKNGGARKPTGKALSIPELKKAFDAVDAETKSILKMASKDAQIKAFQTLWRSVFHRPVTKEAAEGYLAIKRTAGPAGPRGKTRKMRGGSTAPIAGAPLDYVTRPGIDGVHGSFPTYQAQGLSFYNTVNQEGMAQECGIKDITPQVPASIGSNEVMSGGAASDFAQILGNRPVAAVSPPSFTQNIQSYWQGRPVGPSSDPSDNKLKYF